MKRQCLNIVKTPKPKFLGWVYSLYDSPYYFLILCIFKIKYCFLESMKVEDDNDDDHDDYVDDFYNDNHTDKNWEETLPNLEAISVHRGPGRPRRIKSYNENEDADWYIKEMPDSYDNYDSYQDFSSYKKKRGRPRKMGSGGPITPKKRGRPRLILPPSGVYLLASD